MVLPDFFDLLTSTISAFKRKKSIKFTIHACSKILSYKISEDQIGPEKHKTDNFILIFHDVNIFEEHLINCFDDLSNNQIKDILILIYEL